MAVQYANSFSNRVPTWAQARHIHGFLDAFADGKVEHDESGNHTEHANLKAAEMEDLWNGLTQQAPRVGAPLLADAIAWTMPPEYAGIFKVCDSIAAVFAIKCLDEALASIDCSDPFEVRMAMPRAWELFRLRKQQANEVQHGMGCDMAAGWHTLKDIDDIDNTGELLRKMQNIADLAGKMFAAGKPNKKKTESDDPEEVKSTTLGGDLTRLLPSEMGKLCIDETADMQTMKVLKKEAQQFKMKGVRSTTRGPLILTLDESGSMDDQGDNRGRNTWCKAAAVALVRIAWGEGREVRICHFGTDTVASTVPKDDTQALFEMARSFHNSGTNIPGALRRSVAMVGELEADGFKGADIVIITDGNDGKATGPIIDEMDAKGIELHTVAIGSDFRVDANLRKRAAQYAFAHDAALHSDEASVKMMKDLSKAALDNSTRESN